MHPGNFWGLKKSRSPGVYEPYFKEIPCLQKDAFSRAATRELIVTANSHAVMTRATQCRELPM